MNLEQLSQHRLYGLCSKSEKLFLDTYLQTRGDTAVAIRTAFPKVKNLAKYSHNLQQREVLATLMALIDGQQKPTREAVKQIIFDTLLRTKNPARVEGLAKVYEHYDPDPKDNSDSAEERRERARRLDSE